MNRVLHILSALDSGGVESLLKTYLSKSSKHFRFDFVVMGDNVGMMEKDFTQYNSTIYHIPSKKTNIFKHIYEIRKILKTNSYEIVHAHQGFMNFLPLMIALFTKTKIRVCHTHLAKIKYSPLMFLWSSIFKFLSRLVSNKWVACSESAAIDFYGRKRLDKVIIMYNAVEVENFFYDNHARENYRNQFNVTDKLVVGSVGRFTFQKNHYFTIDVFYEICKLKPDSILILVGEGELMTKIEQYSIEKKIRDKILFLGKRNDVNKLYSMFDIFLLPSNFEGLGIVFVESQLSGLPTFASIEGVPAEVKITDTMNFVSLKSDAKEWAFLIVNSTKNSNRTINSNIIKKSNYNINNSLDILYKIYR